jgi:predicted metal-dependent hydrolase
MKLTLDDYQIEVVHRTNKKIKRVSISIENRDEIIIRTPLKFKSHSLKEIIYTNKEWILNILNRVPSNNKFEFVCGGSIPFMGKYYPIKLIPDIDIKSVKLIFENSTFLFYHNPDVSKYEIFLDSLKAFYKKEALSCISPIFEKWSATTGLYPQKVSYRYAKKRWGSCSYVNNISINYMILQFPVRVIEYLVLHELCHIEEKNHSKRFYNLLSSYMPEYKSCEELLKKKVTF